MSMKAGNIAVFGGNGLTGSECVYQALERGDSVTAFCRDPSKLVVRSVLSVWCVGLSVYLPVLATFPAVAGLTSLVQECRGSELLRWWCGSFA